MRILPAPTHQRLEENPPRVKPEKSTLPRCHQSVAHERALLDMAEREHYNVRVGSSHAKSLGITHRTTPLAHPWTGDLRVRFSDFQVNEIGEDGSVVHLRTMGLENDSKKPPHSLQAQSRAEPLPKKEPATKDRHDTKPQDEHKAIEEIAPEDVTALADLSSPDFAQALVQLFNGGNGPASEQPKTAASEPLDDRQQRTQLHGEVRRVFKSRLETSTAPDGAVIASYVPPRKSSRKSRGRRGQPADDEPVGEYLHFTLYKDNRDTMDAVGQIARLLRIKPQAIGYAGTKDRRASTTQRCSVRHQRKRAVAGLNGKLWGMATGDYAYADRPIHLGQLRGNEFVITLKNCNMADEEDASSLAPAARLARMKTNVGSAMRHMASRGWINYFGHQRFGTRSIGTHQIGKLILRGDFEGAVKALLGYDANVAARAEAGDVPDASSPPSRRDELLRHQACMLFQTGKDLDRAARLIPRRYAAESCLLRHLTRAGRASARDYAGAVTHITRGLRSMYLHAYQSHVWNHAASLRHALHGTAVVEGDLVLVDDAPPEEQASPPASAAALDQDGDEIINPLDNYGSDEDQDALPAPRARPLTREEASSGRYTIRDVVLPSPGHSVIYPDNEIGDFYKVFMGREENGGLDPLGMRRLRREFSLPGRYRSFIQGFLADPSVDVRLYADDAEQMHPTDVDLTRGQSGTDGNGYQRDLMVAGDKRKRHETDDQPPDGGSSKKAKPGGGGPKNDKVTGDNDNDEHQVSRPAEDKPPAEPAPEPTKIAVILKFQLASSAYATVVLRELMGDREDDNDNNNGDLAEEKVNTS